MANHKFQFISLVSVFHGGPGNKRVSQISDDCHLLHVLGGSGRVWNDAEEHELTEGSVIAIPPFNGCHFEIRPGFTMLNVHFRLWTHDDVPFEEIVALPLVFRPDYFPRCVEILEQARMLGKTSQQEKLAMDPLVHQLVSLHLSSNPLTPIIHRAGDERIDAVRDALRTPNCRFDAVKLAKTCCLSVSQMNRRFKRRFGLSPRKFWEKSRFGHVRQAMRRADKSLAEIAEEFDFPDQSYFTKWFKKIAKTTPANYKRNPFEQRGL